MSRSRLLIVRHAPNPALNLAPFGRWTLRNEAAQRRLALRLNRMDIDMFSAKQRAAISNAFSYWLEHWDWEMPTLTGLTLEEFRGAAEVWRCSTGKVQESCVLAALGAVRECYAQVGKAPELLGLRQQEAQGLVMLLAKEVGNAV